MLILSEMIAHYKRNEQSFDYFTVVRMQRGKL